MSDKKLSLAVSHQLPGYVNPYGEIPENIRQFPGYQTTMPGNSPNSRSPDDYYRELNQCRYFYRYDPIASSVINRITELAVKTVRITKGTCNDKEYQYFKAVAPMLTKMLREAAREFLVSGMAIPDFTTKRAMGSRIHRTLGRTRMVFPDKIWLRNPENIILRRRPMDIDRSVFQKISAEEKYFIENEGKYLNGGTDRAAYEAFVHEYPQYIEAVRRGDSVILLPNINPIYRKLMTFDDYPQPYLVPALPSLKHKMRIKEMDYSTASRVIEAVRLVRAGSDEFPITEDDDTLTNLRNEIARKNSAGNKEALYTLFTNHTVEMEWVYPPIEALLSDAKYSEPNADIFLALGFSRVLLVGESLRSNASQNVSSSLGPTSAMDEMREQMVEWILHMFETLAEENDFGGLPVVKFPQIASNDLSSLAQFAVEAGKLGAISKDTIANIFNSDFDHENEQIENEAEVTGQMTPYEAAYTKTHDLAEHESKRADEQQKMDKEMGDKDFSLREKIANKPAPSPKQ